MDHNNTTPILQTKNLTREVEGKTIVNDVSLHLQKGEILAVVGASGSGKSSLLRLLNRLDEPSAGTVLFKGKDYKTFSPSELRREIGMVMQQANLFPGTVIDNLRFGPEQRGKSLSLKAVEDLLEQVNLTGYAQRDVSTLSGGEAQRISLARTLANLPEILLLDEPTASLDVASQKGVEDLILSVLERHHLTAILVTHDLDQADHMGDRILSMENGRINPHQQKE